MNHHRLKAIAFAALLIASSAQAGVVVANHDTATLNVTTAGVAQFSRNLVQFLDRDGVAGGEVLVFNPQESLGNSANIGDTRFAQAVALLGYTVVGATTLTPFTLDSLRPYDAVLLAGRIRDGLGQDVKNDLVLAEYVAGGGGVYIAAGAGGFAPDAQAAYWNSFLDDFGIAFEPAFNNRVGVDTVTGGSGSLFAGVSTLSAGNGQDLRLLDPRDPGASLVQLAPGSAVRGLTAVHVGQAPAAVPEPGSLALLGIGLVLLGWRRPVRPVRPGQGDQHAA